MDGNGVTRGGARRSDTHNGATSRLQGLVGDYFVETGQESVRRPVYGRGRTCPNREPRIGIHIQFAVHDFAEFDPELLVQARGLQPAVDLAHSRLIMSL